MKNTERVFLTTKESIYMLKFSQDEVIKNELEKRKRSIELLRAVRLGNLFKNKVSIYFRDSLSRLIRVNTTIWGVTQESVILKKGVIIPLRSIERID